MGLKKSKIISPVSIHKISMMNKKSCSVRVDIAREKRRGFPEVIYCPGKKIEQIKKIARCILKHNEVLLLTRANEKIYKSVRSISKKLVYNKEANLIYAAKNIINEKKGFILVVSAGTSDIPVAEEAAITAELMNNRVERLYDVGVAGIHRLLDESDIVKKANVLIVAAGMEGALASVVSGMVDKPVIGLPTSVGYGASFQGIAPLLTMLNSCSPGISVVNIDNGFGAGYLAALINK